MTDLLIQLWRFFGLNRKIQFAILFLLMLLATIAEVITIGAVVPFLSALAAPDTIFNSRYLRPLVDHFGITQSAQLLNALTLMFIIAVAIGCSVRLILLWMQNRLSHALGSDISIGIFQRVLYQPYSVHISRNTSEILAGITIKANSIVYQIILPILIISSSLLILVAILLILILLNPSIAAVTFLGIGLMYFFVALLTRRRLAAYGKEINVETNRAIQILQEGLGGIRDILIDGSQDFFRKIYMDVDIPLRRAQANVQIFGGAPRFVIESFGMIFISCLALLLSMQMGGLYAAIPILGALALGAQRLLPIFQQSYTSWSLLRSGQSSLCDVLKLLEQKMPSDQMASNTIKINFNETLEVQDLWFRYDPSQPWVLKGVNFTITAGSKIGFIGETGSGKSTLLDILMGLLSPSRGAILIDGIRIGSENCRGWQSQIAHVPQSIYLSDSTISENIAFGNPVEKIDIGRVRFAAQAAQISDAIESWPQAYSTVVGERGVRLSGGQRQRIGIARALYKNANVIILDEATSALDNKTEQEVMTAIDNIDEKKTFVIVAHRHTSLKNCTKIYEISNGAIRRAGNYQEIIGAEV